MKSKQQKEFKGTPGSWTTFGNTILSANFNPIANVGGDTVEREERIANTVLMANAPELLECLEMLLESPNDYIVRRTAKDAINKALTIEKLGPHHC